jgi:hypothetical protein
MRSSDLLTEIVAESFPSLAALTDEEASRAPAPGKWCPKQIVGHLVDSACNNHSRFVRAQFSDELHFPGYRQEEWVAAQRYDAADWKELLALWRSYNLHIARIVGAMPDEELHKARPRDGLDPASWSAVLGNDPVTLDHFVVDYVQHLERHLTQIVRDYVPRSFERPQRSNSAT